LVEIVVDPITESQIQPNPLHGGQHTPHTLAVARRKSLEGAKSEHATAARRDLYSSSRNENRHDAAAPGQLQQLGDQMGVTLDVDLLDDHTARREISP
jgi:hypothetical protein